MGSALWAGISGLNASSKQLDVIANNLANVNTIGFKSDTTFFADVLSSSISGGSSGTLQVGRGVAVSEVQTQFGAGSFETTGNATDVAIDGDGFFLVNDMEGATYYTRAGAFHLDSQGILVDINEYRLQGQMIVNGVPGALGDITLQGLQSSPAVTTTASIGANLNSSTVTGGQFNTTQTVYDSLGASHTLNTTFTKVEDPTVGMWGVQVSLDSNSATSTALNAHGLIFDADGNMSGMYTATATGGANTTATLLRPGMAYKDTTAAITATLAGGVWSLSALGGYANARLVNPSAAATAGDPLQISLDGTGAPDLNLVVSAGVTASVTLDNTPIAVTDIQVDFGALLPLNSGATIGNAGVITWDLTSADALEITQYASSSVIRAITADGYSSGQLKTLSIGTDGIVSGFFTNGQTSELAQIILASFPNPWALNKLGSNLFGETVMSGSSIRNTPGSSGMGTLTPNTLEMSNTDIATEFIRMITAQKAYQSNARVITTQDTIMQELMNLKR